MPTHRFPRQAGRTRTGGRYGPQHQRARKTAAARHHPDDPCARCHHPLGPMNRDLHYDHDEYGSYLGFSHGNTPCPICGHRCNLRAGAIKGNQAQQATLHGTSYPLRTT